jgi:enoyl-CoA hydratase/carnithine racemase
VQNLGRIKDPQSKLININTNNIIKKGLEHVVVITEKHAGWAELILNRPERCNAITGSIAEALASEIKTMDADEDVNIILFPGAGGAFCTGADFETAPCSQCTGMV